MVRLDMPNENFRSPIYKRRLLIMCPLTIIHRMRVSTIQRSWDILLGLIGRKSLLRSMKTQIRILIVPPLRKVTALLHPQLKKAVTRILPLNERRSLNQERVMQRTLVILVKLKIRTEPKTTIQVKLKKNIINARIRQLTQLTDR